jgi:hypothetical protein
MAAMDVEGLVVGESWIIVGIEIVIIMINVVWILRDCFDKLTD